MDQVVSDVLATVAQHPSEAEDHVEDHSDGAEITASILWHKRLCVT